MRKLLLLVAILPIALTAYAAQPETSPDWRGELARIMPLMGHRNWVLVVDSAYPLQTGPGIETIETNESHVDVVRTVLHAIDHSIHVRPVIYMDSELPFVPDADAPGASDYRNEITPLLRPYTIQSMPHDRMIATVAATAQQFHVLILKTNMTIPYSSVFIQLNCKYWSDDAEKRLRSRMTSSPQLPR
jgi:hypothetical protein